MGPGPGDAHVTLSVGVATSAPPAAGFDELWQAADAAMYEAKRGGGDMVCFRGLNGDANPLERELVGHP
jgi:PleD family two-component response regulator